MTDEMKEAYRHDVKAIYKLASRIRLTDANEAKRVRQYAVKNDVFKTSVGDKFLERLVYFEGGGDGHKDCLFCGSEADNGVICDGCLSKMRGIAGREEQGMISGSGEGISNDNASNKSMQRTPAPEKEKGNITIQISTNMVIAIAIAAVIVFSGAFGAYRMVKSVERQQALEEAERQQKAEEAAREQEEAAREQEQAQALAVREEYEKNYKTAVFAMIESGADAEACGNLIYAVWRNAIYKENDSKTDKYTCPNGYFVGDFNEAIQNLFDDSDFRDKISGIEIKKEVVVSIVRELNNPPSEYAQAYDALIDCFDAYNNYVNQIISPNGSLNTFSSNLDSASNVFSSAYDKLKIYIE